MTDSRWNISPLDFTTDLICIILSSWFPALISIYTALKFSGKGALTLTNPSRSGLSSRLRFLIKLVTFRLFFIDNYTLKYSVSMDEWNTKNIPLPNYSFTNPYCKPHIYPIPTTPSDVAPYSLRLFLPQLNPNLLVLIIPILTIFSKLVS